MRIMIVDDNASFRTKIKKMILDQRFDDIELYEFSCGSGAVESYTKLKPDLILMDIQMDDMDGFAASKLIKKIDPAAKIIIVTQYDDSAYREYADELGLSAYVTKDQLNDVIGVLETFTNIN